MLKLLIIIICFFTVIPRYTDAASKNTGVGFITGDLTGLTFKTWAEPQRSAIDLSLSWSSSEITAQIGLLVHNYEEFGSINGVFGFYFGPGTRFKAKEGDASRLGVRGTAGLSYLFPERVYELFIELSPVIYLVPASEFSMGGGVGARHFF